MESKGTASMEFLFTSMIMLIICSGLVFVISDRLDMVSTTEKLSEGRMLIEMVANDINEVYSAGNGRNKYISLPPQVGNSSYSLKVNSSGVYIDIVGMVGKADIYPMKIIDGHSNSSHSIEMLPGKTYLLKNMNMGNSSVILIYSQ